MKGAGLTHRALTERSHRRASRRGARGDATPKPPTHKHRKDADFRVPGSASSAGTALGTNRDGSSLNSSRGTTPSQSPRVSAPAGSPHEEDLDDVKKQRAEIAMQVHRAVVVEVSGLAIVYSLAGIVFQDHDLACSLFFSDPRSSIAALPSSRAWNCGPEVKELESRARVAEAKAEGRVWKDGGGGLLKRRKKRASQTEQPSEAMKKYVETMQNDGGAASGGIALDRLGPALAKGADAAARAPARSEPRLPVSLSRVARALRPRALR